jgi:hypothetical protein
VAIRQTRHNILFRHLLITSSFCCWTRSSSLGAKFGSCYPSYGSFPCNALTDTFVEPLSHLSRALVAFVKLFLSFFLSSSKTHSSWFSSQTTATFPIKTGLSFKAHFIFPGSGKPNLGQHATNQQSPRLDASRRRRYHSNRFTSILLNRKREIEDEVFVVTGGR